MITLWPDSLLFLVFAELVDCLVSIRPVGNIPALVKLVRGALARIAIMAYVLQFVVDDNIISYVAEFFKLELVVCNQRKEIAPVYQDHRTRLAALNAEAPGLACKKFNFSKLHSLAQAVDLLRVSATCVLLVDFYAPVQDKINTF